MTASDSGDVEADIHEINRITSSWIVDDRPTRFGPRGSTKTYISKVPAALSCLNRAVKETLDPDQAYELKFRVMLICARLGWARDCMSGDGYRVDRYMFHLPLPIDCSLGNEVEFRNIDHTKIDDPERALVILEQFVESHPLTLVEEAALLRYRQKQEQERLAYEARCAHRAMLEDELLSEDLDDDFDEDLDDLW